MQTESSTAVNYKELINAAQAQKNLSDLAAKNICDWLDLNKDQKTLDILHNLIAKQDWQELEDSFYRELSIGTGGIRGKIGPGINRINFFTIGRAAQGLSDFIASFGLETMARGVVVGYDVRHFSKELAEMCCHIFQANGISPVIFSGICSTPEVSFMVKHLGKTAGVMITASHNPRTDNGFKFYWSDGGQVVPPNDAAFMNFLKDGKQIKSTPDNQVNSVNLVEPVAHQAYIQQINTLSLVKSRSAKIVYSPIHGSGSTNVIPVLEQNNFNFTVVPEQAQPDGDFPTAHGDLINPEFKEVSEMAINLAVKTGADLAIISDPDADRIGVGAKEHLNSDAIRFLNGNEVGTALAHFILTQKKSQLSADSVLMITNVTSTLISEIGKSFGITVYDDLLVGFKFFAEIIEKQQLGDKFIFAAEESMGYLRGTFVRDKDAAIAALTIAEMASYLKDQGLSLVDYLNQIYKEHGYYKNRLYNIELPGKDGAAAITQMMLGLRQSPPSNLAGLDCVKIIDRLPEPKRSMPNYITGATGDQIAFIFSADGKSKLTIRPSGTEPKVKLYTQVFGATAQQNLEEVIAKTDRLAEQLERQMLEFLKNSKN